jgi:hypothetical protein
MESTALATMIKEDNPQTVDSMTKQKSQEEGITSGRRPIKDVQKETLIEDDDISSRNVRSRL